MRKRILIMIIGLINSPLFLVNGLTANAKINQATTIAGVPFTAQAPFGNWTDQRQQNGCEEASALMAIKWAQGKTLSKEQSLKEITSLANWLKKKHGESRDSSTEDTVNWILKEYFNYPQATLKHNVNLEDIVKELTQGKIVIAPMDGRLLGNPYFKQPGPPRHMLVIHGFDPIKKQFITNDPGTKNGKDYRYNYNILYRAIRDYPTGYNKTINKIEKNIIVISR